MDGRISRLWTRGVEICTEIWSKSTLSWRLRVDGGPVDDGQERMDILRG